ncbi:homocysteine S-methyltransferase family protein [Natroniella acetigena]|uniref:homocysteine S-methyltransferase family protein n=1 Tax=Natroniella acetigena TaxID=52004 RepID=UPI00200A0931|nr:homocysteine S-methyltransferase family protein [Natroniella acetigena]MCK8828185.1 homocysteine S-methyltransferase family protein [Natroniella acetigena]
MSQLLNRLKEEILILDGAMGTELQNKGLEVGNCPENLNLTYPQILKEIHASYVEAGSDIIQTNTFGANSIKLAKYGLSEELEAINTTAVKLAQEAATENTLISASIGPTGKLFEPMGALSFEEAYQVFAQQAEILAAAGVDLVNIETMIDLQEAKAALIAVKENTSLPVICNLTYETGQRTVTGTDPATAITVLQAAGADIIGANCGLGPAELTKIIHIMDQQTASYLAVQPNAGLPILDENNQTIFPMEAEEMASYGTEFVAAGANIIGGCCGSNPDYISLLRREIKDLKPKSKPEQTGTKLASRTQQLSLSQEKPIIIGDKIDSTKPTDLAAELENNKTKLLDQATTTQEQAGADIISCNLSNLTEPEQIKKIINTVQIRTRLPLALKLEKPELLEIALQSIVGKPVVQLVNPKQEKLERILTLVRKYGATTLVPTLIEAPPITVEKIMVTIENNLKLLTEFGLQKEEIIVDLPNIKISPKQNSVQQILTAIKSIKENLNLLTALKISHTETDSIKLETDYINMLTQVGLDLIILDPTQNK